MKTVAQDLALYRGGADATLQKLSARIVSEHHKERARKKARGEPDRLDQGFDRVLDALGDFTVGEVRSVVSALMILVHNAGESVPLRDLHL